MKKHLSTLLAAVLIFSSLLCLPSAAASPEAEMAAETLSRYGLFSGRQTGESGTISFALDDAPTRAEALIMLIRLLGKEGEALSGSWRHPFRDVPYWADRYVGYAYEKQLALGIGPTAFGSTQTASAAQYITFVLRALGYTDSGTAPDFSWRNAPAFSGGIGLTHGEYDDREKRFLRGDVAVLSAKAMTCRMKHTGQTLYDTLVTAGAIHPEVFTDPPATLTKPLAPVLSPSSIRWDGGTAYLPLSKREPDGGMELTNAAILSAFPETVYYEAGMLLPEAQAMLKENYTQNIFSPFYELPRNMDYAFRFTDRLNTYFSHYRVLLYNERKEIIAMAYGLRDRDGKLSEVAFSTEIPFDCAAVISACTRFVEERVQSPVEVDLTSALQKIESRDGSTLYAIRRDACPEAVRGAVLYTCTSSYDVTRPVEQVKDSMRQTIGDRLKAMVCGFKLAYEAGQGTFAPVPGQGLCGIWLMARPDAINLVVLMDADAHVLGYALVTGAK